MTAAPSSSSTLSWPGAVVIVAALALFAFMLWLLFRD